MLKLEIRKFGAGNAGQMSRYASNIPAGTKVPAINTSRGLVSVNNAVKLQEETPAATFYTDCI